MRRVLTSSCLVVLITGLIGAAAIWHAHRQVSTAHPKASMAETAVMVSPVKEAVSPEDYPQPSASSSDADLLAMARRMMALSPAQALQWANAQSDPALHQRMMLAVLRAWGEKDPASAVDWVLTQDDTAREACMRAAMNGAANQPEMAMQVARTLLANDPDNGPAYASMLAGAFCAKGDFQEALRFINSAAPRSMNDSVNVTFNTWAQSQPQAALDAADNITDPQLQLAAFHQAANTWNASDPAGLATYAEKMPSGAGRDYALKTAMDNWSLQDPAALAGWLNTLPAGADYDAGVAMMITKTDGANRTPEAALQWVENIGDQTLQLDSLMQVLSEWNQSDPAAARQYVINMDWIGDQQRQIILGKMGTGQ